MTSISQLSNWQPAAPRPAAAAGWKAQAQPGEAAAPSAIVRLSPESLAAAKAGAADSAPVLPAAVRFKGAGAAMLNQFKSGAAIPVSPPGQLPANADNQFTLSITTRSGVKAELALASEGDGMVFQISASGELNEAERGAMSALAEGFQAAIDGLLKDDPKVRLAGLAQFDATQLASVDLRAAVQAPTLPPSALTLEFHADRAQRTVSLEGAAGKADVKVDASKAESLGTKEQQAKAISHYLKQFDQASERGHGDTGLMAMFKDIFADMSRTSSTDAEQERGLTVPGEPVLALEEHAVLTGLADFSASVTQAAKFSNPLRLGEKDGFDYSVAQSTSVEGSRRDDRSLSQKQESRLTAQFHEALEPGSELRLGVNPESQSYRYTRINDTASSNVELGYKEGRLIKATLQQHASRSTHAMDYFKGKLIADKTVPSEQALMRDLLPSLGWYRIGEGSGTAEEREQRRGQVLGAVNAQIFLPGSPKDVIERRP